MTLNDTKIILQRIKTNYQSFVNDDYVLKEWYKELKDYDVEDIMDKLEQHMRSSEYGQTFPKLYFLTKYLKKTKEKGKIEKLILRCPLCEKYVKEDDFDKHYQRCLDVNYIVRKRKECFDKETTLEEINRFKTLSDDIFDRKYMDFIGSIYNSTPKEEQKNLDNIICTR